MSKFKSQPNESLPMLLRMIQCGEEDRAIKIVVEKHKKTSIDKVIADTRVRKNKLIGILLHIKKGGVTKTLTYKDSKKSASTDQQMNYSRMLLIADEALKPFIVIIKQDSKAMLAFSCYQSLELGDFVAVVKPCYVGQHRGTDMIEAEWIIPHQSDSIFTKQIQSTSIVTNDQHHCYKFETSNFFIEDFADAQACTLGCDGHYLDSCYCIKRQRKDSWILGLKFGLEDHKEIKFKHYCSFRLTQALVSSDLMENEGKKKKGKLVIDEIYEHIEEELEGKTLIFTIWFKPSKKEDAESNFLSIGHISDVSYAETVTLNVFKEKTQVATLPPAQPNDNREHPARRSDDSEPDDI